MKSENYSLPTLGLYVAAISVTAFVLNWLWEMLQMSAYVEMANRSWNESSWRCTVATFGDLAFTLGIVAMGCLAAGSRAWGLERSWNVYAAASLMGAAVAIAIEQRAIAAGKWSYNDRMPILPILEVGLWPCLQLSILVPLSLLIASLVARRSSKST